MNIKVRKINENERKRKELCLEQLTSDRQKLLMRWPFVGGVIMRMDLIAVRDDRLETACTDGNNIFVDINFYDSLKKDERLFVLAHEVWHSVMLHFARKQDRNRELFNIAADLEIHFALADEKMNEPWVLPHSELWSKLSAEEIYEQLQKHPAYQEKVENFDKHLYSDEKSNQFEDDENSGNGTEFVTDDDFTPFVGDDTAERVRGRVIAAAQQIERMQGKLPANISRLIEHLEKPSLPWQELLKQFVTSSYGGKRRYLPPSRRHVWHGLYLPSMRSEKLKAVVALDTSGSTAEDAGFFMGEVVSLMKSFGSFDLTVIQCDAAIQSVEHYTQDNIPSPNYKWKYNGGGGTDFRPVFNYVAKDTLKPDLLIYFTDGYGTAPVKQPDYPVMWVLTENCKSPCRWGRQVKKGGK